LPLQQRLGGSEDSARGLHLSEISFSDIVISEVVI
jgi:hypothetical protein